MMTYEVTYQFTFKVKADCLKEALTIAEDMEPMINPHDESSCRMSMCVVEVDDDN